MGRNIISSLWAGLLAVGLSAGSVLADEAGGKAEPSLFGGHLVTSIVTAIIFLVLLAVLGKFAWKPLLESLKKREEMIRNDIESARTERERAEKTLEEYQQRLASAQKEAEDILKATAVEAEKRRNQILDQAETQARQSVDHARSQIDAAKQDALKEIYQHSAALATDLAAKILQREVNPEDHRILIREAMEQLEEEQRGK